MNGHKQELVSGLLDGQLKGIRRLFVARHVRACPVCAAEYRHQQHVRRMLRANPPTAQMSDSPEFFWSKVKAEIERRGDQRAEAPTPSLSSLDWLQQNSLALATAAAVLVAALGAFWFVKSQRHGPGEIARLSPAPAPVAEKNFAKVERVSTVIPNTLATAFDSPEADVTVIWVSGLPWTADMTEMKTQFANLDT